VPPSHDGSQVFVAHAKAVQSWRDAVLEPWCVRYAKAALGKPLDQVRAGPSQ
jgi:hypothetical protein